jgi:hypothetical protein
MSKRVSIGLKDKIAEVDPICQWAWRAAGVSTSIPGLDNGGAEPGPTAPLRPPPEVFGR